MSAAPMPMPMPGAGAITIGAPAALAGGAGFVAGWTFMMAAMMLPSLAPTLRRYHRAVPRERGGRPVGLTTIVVVGYLAVWAAVGALIYPAELEGARRGAALSVRATASVVAIVVLAAGAMQFTRWKARHLDCCRAPRGVRRAATGGIAGAWRLGVRLGWHCVNSSAAVMLLLLVVGMMDLRAMAAVTGAITAERLAPARARVAWMLGGIGVCSGLALLVRAIAR